MAHNPDVNPLNDPSAEQVQLTKDEILAQQQQAEVLEQARQNDEAKMRAGIPTADQNAGIVPASNATPGGGAPGVNVSPGLPAPPVAPAPVAGRFAATPQAAASGGPQPLDTSGIEHTGGQLNELYDADYAAKLAALRRGGGAATKVHAAWVPTNRQTTTAGVVPDEVLQSKLMADNGVELAAKESQDAAAEQQRSALSQQADEDARFAREREEDQGIGRLKADAIRKKQDEKFAQIEAAKVDPKRWWAEKDTGSKIGIALAMGFGAFGAALTHGPNYALEQITKAKDADVDAQIRDVDKMKSEHSLIQQSYIDTLEETRSTVAARAAAHEIATKQIANQAQQMALSTTSTFAQKQNDLLQAKLAQHAADYREQQAKAIYGTRQGAEAYRPEHVVGPGGPTLKDLIANRKAKLGDQGAIENAQKEARASLANGGRGPRTIVIDGKLVEVAPGVTDEQANERAKQLTAADTLAQTVRDERENGPGVFRRLLAKIPGVGLPAGSGISALNLAAANSQLTGAGTPNVGDYAASENAVGSLGSRDEALDKYERTAREKQATAASALGIRVLGDAPIRPVHK